MALTGIAKEAVTRAGGSRKVGETLGISPPAINQWGDRIPEARIADMARLSGMSEQELRAAPTSQPTA